MQQVKLFIQDFGHIIKVHYRENWWATLIAIGAFAIITLYKYINIITLWSEFGWLDKFASPLESNRELCTFLIVAITIIYTVSCTLKNYGDSKRIHDAMLLPASLNAKFFAEVLYSLVFLPLMMFAILFVADTATVSICTNGVESASLVESLMNYPQYLRSTSFLYTLLLFHSVATVWRADNRWTGRQFVGAIVLFLIFYANSPLKYPFIMSSFAASTPGWITIAFRMDVSWFNCEAAVIISKVFYATAPLMLYAISYFKLKERSL